jgi:hypothetical protein
LKRGLLRSWELLSGRPNCRCQRRSATGATIWVHGTASLQAGWSSTAGSSKQLISNDEKLLEQFGMNQERNKKATTHFSIASLRTRTEPENAEEDRLERQHAQDPTGKNS